MKTIFENAAFLKKNKKIKQQ